MKKLNTIIITKGFPPIEGGIETYMYQVADRWTQGEVKVICDATHKPVPNCFKFEVIRVPKIEISFVSALLKLSIAIISHTKQFLLAIQFILLLSINRTFVKYTISKLDAFIDEISSNDEETIIQCATHIYSGTIGLIGKIIYGKKLVIYIHGSELLKYRKRFTAHIFQKFILKNADLIVANSNYTKSIAVDMSIPEKKIKVINLGADINKFYPIDTKEEVFRRFEINKHDFVLLTVAHIIPRKGFDKVIQAMPKILSEVPNVKYLICGKGNDSDRIRELIKDLNLQNNVIFAGFIPDEMLNNIFNSCDLFILPNRKEGYDVEGFGIVFLEANACKKPVIAGNSGGAVDAVIDGETGLLVDSMSAEDIADKTIELLTNEERRNEIALAGYERVIRKLNWGEVVPLIEKTILGLYD